jgi:hypothetical protein
MLPAAKRAPRGWSLTRRLTAALSVGALFIAVVLGFFGADRDDRQREQQQADAERELAMALAERVAPVLERRDLMRLSVLCAVARDQVQGRLLVLDRAGKVVLDTAVVLGDRQLSLLTNGASIQRTTPREGGDAGEPPLLRETLVPVRFGGEPIGELRLQCPLVATAATFDVSWFGLVLLGCLSLVIVAATMGHHWSARVRSATDALIRLSAGEAGGVRGDATEGEFHDLGMALREMERGLQDGLQRVAEGFVGMALAVVEGLERGRLIPPGHGERTAKLALRLATRAGLSTEDRADLELACRLVDLGKAWVRPAILQKQGPLSEVESQSLRQHPVRAAEHLECMPAMRRAALILKHQAERYDGSGGPHALRGDRIPVGSRILAIAAAFDLMTVCTGDHLVSWQEALLRLQRARGEVFDPSLLDLFVDEVQKQPPGALADRPVMIVPGNSVPWQAAEERGAMDGIDADDDEDEDEEPELEVLTDEPGPEEQP